MGRHILIHGRPLGLDEMIAKIEAVSIAGLADLVATTLASAPTLSAIGPPGSLPALADLAAGMESRKAAVGW
jgi:hypothetical protein